MSDDDRLISLPELRDLVFRRTGRKIASATVYNWVNRGIKGRRLGVVRVGGRIYTTEGAIEQWFVSESHRSDSPYVVRAALRAEREAGEVFG